MQNPIRKKATQNQIFNAVQVDRLRQAMMYVAMNNSNNLVGYNPQIRHFTRPMEDLYTPNDAFISLCHV